MRQDIVRDLIALVVVLLVFCGAWATGISVGDTYFYTDGDDSGGNKEHALYRENIVSYDDAYDTKCVAVPVYGATSIKEIIPRFALGTAVESDFAWVEVVPDQILFEKVAKPVWSKKENWGSRWGVDTSSLWYEWDMDIWPTGRVQDGRFWIIAAHDSSNVPQLQKNSSRLGVATFRISAVGAENWSNSAMFIREPPAELLNKNDIGVYLRGIAFERDPNKQMFGYTINGTAIHGFGIRDALDDGSLFRTETTLVLNLDEAGTLVLSAPAEDDEDNLNRISKTQLTISGGGIISDSEDYFARTIDNPLRTGWDHRRIVKVSSNTRLTMKNYSWCMSFQDMAFYPKGRQSVNIRASFFTPTQRSVAYQCGVVYGTGVYKLGEMAELTAMPGEGETFHHWEMSDGGNLPDGVDAKNPIIRFIVTEDMCGNDDDFRTMTLKACWVENELEVDLESASIHDYEKPSSYGPIIGGMKYTLHVGLIGYTAKELPPGLKYDSKTGTVTGTVKTPGEYKATFTKNGEADETVMFRVRAEKVSVGCVGLSLGAFTAGVAGNADGIPFEIETETGIKSVSVSKLPAGMKYDAKTGLVTGGPTKAGDYEVSVAVTTMSGTKQVVAIPVKVAAAADGAVGTFNGFVKASDGEENLGTFKLTTTAAGKLTAKITTAAGAYSFNGTCWDSVTNGVYSVALVTKKGETLTLALDSMAGWHENQLTGTFATVAGQSPRQVVARKNAFGKMWYFNAEGNETTGWLLSYAENAKAAALTVTLNADGSTKIAGKLGTLSVNASGYADVTGLTNCVIFASFAPVVSLKEGKATVKKALSLRANLWFDRSNAHPEGVGSARLVE